MQFSCATHVDMTSITLISSKMYDFLYNNKVKKFPLAFPKGTACKVGTTSGLLAH